MKQNVKLSSPWAIYYREIDAMFGDDPEIKIDFDETANIIKMYVDNSEKADAISKLLPSEKVFGNVVLKIQVIPGDVNTCARLDLFQKAFKGNPALSYTTEVKEGIFPIPFEYVVFQNKVVQYFNDDLNDINGLCSTLYQEIAKDLFGEKDGVYFCTDTPK